MTPQETLSWAYENYPRVALVASFQAESVVLIDMAAQLVEEPEAITLDTGRLPQETLRYMQRIRDRYRLRLHVETPDRGELQPLLAEHGPELFRTSVELRKRCCEVRKVLPLGRALQGFDAWVTGLRREQSVTRRETVVLEHDTAHGGIARVAPLAGWTRQQVWDYAAERGIELHPYYARGYTSIGCEPCTRPTRPGEDERAGRWWWERSEVKECGIFPAVAS